jgi:four helix bundle protein
MSTTSIKIFKDLVVWQKASELLVEIYLHSGEFPQLEVNGLASELRKTSGSIPYNIAGGYKRWSTVEYVRFLRISAGSAAELETQILRADRLGYFSKDAARRIIEMLSEIAGMLDALIRSLITRIKPNP